MMVFLRPFSLAEDKPQPEEFTCVDPLDELIRIL